MTRPSMNFNYRAKGQMVKKMFEKSSQVADFSRWNFPGMSNTCPQTSRNASKYTPMPSQTCPTRVPNMSKKHMKTSPKSTCTSRESNLAPPGSESACPTVGLTPRVQAELLGASYGPQKQALPGHRSESSGEKSSFFIKSHHFRQ